MHLDNFNQKAYHTNKVIAPKIEEKIQIEECCEETRYKKSCLVRTTVIVIQN